MTIKQPLNSNVYYFLGNIPSHITHALPLYEVIGGTFVVISQASKDALAIYDVPIVCLDDTPDLLLELDSSVKQTISFLNQNARVVLFYELFSFPRLYNLTGPKKVFLTHGNMLKSYMTSNPHRLKMLKNYDYMAAISPYLKREFIEDNGIVPTKLIDLGIARTDAVIKHRGEISGAAMVAQKLDLDPTKPFFSYMPTYWGASSVYHIGKELVRHFPEYYNLLFRPHPQTPLPIIDDYKRIIKQRPNVRYIPDGYDTSLDMLALFNASSAIIGDVSSVMLEAILIDKPLIFAEVTGDEKQEAKDLVSIKEIAEYSAKLNVRTMPTLGAVLENAIARGINEDIWKLVKKRTFFHYDGTSVKAIARFVTSLL